MGRRALLRASARAGVAAAGLALVGCGGEDDDEPPDDQAEADEQAAAQAQADAQASDEQAAAQAQSTPDDAVSPEGGEGVAAPAAEPKPGGIARLFATTDNFDRFDPAALPVPGRPAGLQPDLQPPAATRFRLGRDP